jgi:hypothetical protein
MKVRDHLMNGPSLFWSRFPAALDEMPKIVRYWRTETFAGCRTIGPLVFQTNLNNDSGVSDGSGPVICIERLATGSHLGGG